MTRSARSGDRPAGSRRLFWLRQLHQWHWISSAICLAGMLLFAITGITLNHAGEIEAGPSVREREALLPADLLAALNDAPVSDLSALPPALKTWIAERLGIDAGSHPAEWSAQELYLALPRPGGDAWLSVDRETGMLLLEETDRGWIAYFNDLHKGRNTGAGWRWLIDLFAVACLLFCITGLLLLQLHAGHRPATWPVVGAGLAIPLAVAILLIH